MAAPEYVPGPVAEQPRVYQSPPRRPDSWTNNRPGDFNGPQPEGPGLGSPGPDQGYAMKLARQFEGQLSLGNGEHEADAVAGCLAVALKRASIFGRAPMVHDLTVGFAVWGYLGEGDDDLVAARQPLFEECSHPHHYMERRIIADSVPEAVLRLTPAQVRLEVANDWRSLIQLPGQAAPHVPAPMAAAVPAPSPVVDQPVAEDVAVEDVAIVEDAPVAHEPPPPPPAPVVEPEPAPAPAAAAPALPTRAPSPTADEAASDVDVEAEVDPAALPEVDHTAPVEEAPAIAEEPVPGVEVSSDVQKNEDETVAEPVAEQPAELPPALRKPVKPVPVNPEEIAKLAREAKYAFQKQSHHKKPPENND